MAARRTIVAGILAVAGSLTAAAAGAQTPAQQGTRPQPAPSPIVAPPKTGGATASPPQTSPPKPVPVKPPLTKKPGPPRTSRVWKGRGFFVATGGAQVVAPGYSSTATFTVHAEDASLAASSRIRVGPVFSVRGGMRVWKNLALGGDVGVASTTQRVAVDGSLPHPFLFNAFRKVEGTAPGLARLETMVAIEGSWLIAVRKRVDMFLFAGPAYFSVRQDMATGIRFTEVYPYDTATFTGVNSTSVRGSAAGFTAGADMAYLVTRRLGVGGEMRYSYASATLKPTGQRAAVSLGGLQVSVGARILF